MHLKVLINHVFLLFLHKAHSYFQISKLYHHHKLQFHNLQLHLRCNIAGLILNHNPLNQNIFQQLQSHRHRFHIHKSHRQQTHFLHMPCVYIYAITYILNSGSGVKIRHIHTIHSFI